MKYRVLLVDGHRILRDGISAILSGSGEFEVAGEAGSGLAALRFVKLHCPDLVLMEVGLPGLDGVETAIEILRTNPGCRIVILSEHADDNTVLGAIRAGARGFILKNSSQNELLSALRMVATGGMYICPQVSDRLVERLQKGDFEDSGIPSVLSMLSPREVQVLRLVAQGRSSKEIAAVLELSEQTVRSYRKTLMRKLRVNNAVTLSQVAYSTGLAHIPRKEVRPEMGRFAEARA
jgi:DNA-binding NarL/FixJ family response regulator